MWKQLPEGEENEEQKQARLKKEQRILESKGVSSIVQEAEEIVSNVKEYEEEGEEIEKEIEEKEDKKIVTKIKKIFKKEVKKKGRK